MLIKKFSGGVLKLLIYKSYPFLFLVSLSLFLLIACSGRPTQKTPVSTENKESTTTSVESKDSGVLVIYSGRKESLVGPIIEQFKDATGIDVKVKYGKTGEIAATILEEGDKSPADVFFAQDPGGLGAIANADMLKILPDSILGKVPSWAVSGESLWVGISGRARAVVYNTENVDPADLPDTLEGFTDPKWNT